MDKKEKENFECIICSDFPKLPVALPCGHIYCWNCLKAWVRDKPKLNCPICKNGFEMSKVVKLFIGPESKENDDRPKAEYIPGVENKDRPGFINNVLNAFGFYGTQPTQGINEQSLPNRNDVLLNRMSVIVLAIGVFLILYVFNS